MFTRWVGKSAYTRITGVILITTAVVLLTGCAHDVPPMNCDNSNFACHIEQALKGIVVVRENINYWSNVQMCGQIFAVVAGIISTIVIALQGDDNRHWTRPLGLVSTTLGTGVASAIVAFHVPDNIDKLIDISGRMTEIVNKLSTDSTLIMKGQSQADWEKRFNSDEMARVQALEILNGFSSNWSKAKIDMMRVSGTAARLNTSGVSPSDPPQKPKSQ